MAKKHRKSDRSTIIAWLIIFVIAAGALYFLFKTGRIIQRGFSHGIGYGILTTLAILLMLAIFWFADEIRDWWHRR